MTASSPTSEPTYCTDKTTNQIISALNAKKKVLLILDNELTSFNIIQATSYVKIESLIDETQIQYRLYFANNVPFILSSQSLQDPFILTQESIPVGENMN